MPDTTKYCFEVGDPVLGPVYDADRAEFTVKVPSESAPLANSQKQIRLVLQREVRPEDRRGVDSLSDVFDEVPSLRTTDAAERPKARPTTLVDADTIILRLAAVPDVARRVKPLIREFRYYIVGRVDHGRRAGEGSPARQDGSYSDGMIDFVVEELVIVRGAQRCVVARIPATRTTVDLTYFTVE